MGGRHGCFLKMIMGEYFRFDALPNPWVKSDPVAPPPPHMKATTGTKENRLNPIFFPKF